jgi:two-component system chemotaxis sensor kinase CheA
MDTADYLGVFLDESREHIESLYDQLLKLEQNPSEIEIINEIFRSAHTLKGMSATMGYTDLSELTHKLENVFDAIKHERVHADAEMIDVMFETVDLLNEMIEDVGSGGDGSKDVNDIVTRLKEMADAKADTPDISTEKQSETTMKKNADNLQAVNHLTWVDSVDQYEETILNQSAEQGYTNYEIRVTLEENCLLKGARAFMVFEVLEKMGEIVKADPPVNELEDENFDQSFVLLFVSKEEKEIITSKVFKISEIETVEIHPLDDILFRQDTGKKEANEGKEAVSAQQRREKQSKQEEKKGVQKKEKGTNAGSTSVSNKTIRVNIERLDNLLNLFEEFVIDRGRLQQISSEMNHRELTETVEHIQRVSEDLQNVILNIRMVPIETVFNRFPRMIRQLSRDLDKNVRVEIVGKDTELDRTVIDQIGDPLVHLIRNALDHGIETKAERKEKGKPVEGLLRLKAYHSGNHVFIEISDDGAGINREKVLEKAIERGLVSADKADQMTDRQVAQLILASGFSTAEQVSNVSGRGVGLDVVKDTIESLGGKITIDSEVNKGSTFSVQLPLTLSIISVLLVELQDEKYAIPLSSIIETAVIHEKEIKQVHHNQVIDFRGNIIPLVFLSEVFSVPKTKEEEESEYHSVVIIKKGEKLTGLVVDAFIGQQEVVLKSLGKYLTNTFAISGATILGNGEVALIIDSNALST